MIDRREFYKIIESAIDAVVMMDDTGKVTFWNEAAEKLLGYSEREAIGEDLHKLIVPEKYYKAYHNGLKEFKQTGTGNFIGKTLSMEGLRKDGGKFVADHAFSAVKIDNRWQAVSIIRDVTMRKQVAGDTTERKKAEEELKIFRNYLEAILVRKTKELKDAQEQLVRNQKLATVGLVSASIAHELRNPLATIESSSYYLSRALKDADDKVKKHLALIHDTVLLSNNIISSLLDFTKAKQLSLVKSDVNRIVKDVLKDIKTVEGITINTQLDKNLPEIPLDTMQILIVFRNIISNALQAMPEGGSLDIKTDVKCDFVRVAFKDTGTGISKENIQKIYEPLFTTKAKGIGLGLTLVKTIIDGHNGSILSVVSEIGKGTTFTLRFPIATETTQEKVLPEPGQKT